MYDERAPERPMQTIHFRIFIGSNLAVEMAFLSVVIFHIANMFIVALLTCQCWWESEACSAVTWIPSVVAAHESSKMAHSQGTVFNILA